MGYSAPKKPFDLKQFLSEKASPRATRWRYGAAASARKPDPAPAAAEASDPSATETPPETK